MSDDKLLQKLTEAWQAMQEASLPQPGAVAIIYRICCKRT